MAKLEIMRIPFATVLFLASVFLITQYFINFNNVLGDIGAAVCICALVYSLILYSRLDISFSRP